MANSIGVPSVQGMKSAFGDFAVGAIGGLAYALSQSLFGNGIIGAIVAPVLAGSVVKGNRGTALATVAGFMLLSGMGQARTASAEASSDSGVM